MVFCWINMCKLVCKGIDKTRSNSATEETLKLEVKYIGVTKQPKSNSQFPFKKMVLHYPICSQTFPALHLYEHEVYAAGLKSKSKNSSKLLIFSQLSILVDTGLEGIEMLATFLHLLSVLNAEKVTRWGLHSFKIQIHGDESNRVSRKHRFRPQ